MPMSDPHTDSNTPLEEVEELLREPRSKRFTVYIDPSLAEAANELVEGERFSSVSVVLDIALRRQLLHELQLRADYVELLEELDNLPTQLASTVSSSRSTRRSSGFVGDDSEGQKVCMSGRTNPGLYLLETLLIQDNDVGFTTESAFVEKGLWRIVEVEGVQ